MNVFAEIQWDLPRLGKFLDDEYLQENSATYRLLEDRVKVPKNCRRKRHFDDDEGDKALEPNTKEIFQDPNPAIDLDEPMETDPALRTKRHIAGLVAHLPFPKYSAISKDDQATFIRLHAKFMNRKLTLASNVSVSEQKEFATYVDLNNKVMTERAEFLTFLKDRWLIHIIKHYVIASDIERYVSRAWKHRLVKRPPLYMEYYNKTKSIPLVYQGDKSAIQLMPSKILLQMGIVPVIINPKFQYRVQIPQDCTKVSQRYPPDCKYPEMDTGGTLHKLSVSEDPNCNKLAKSYGVDLVISSSGLKALANNHSDFKRGWDLPVIVREFVTEDSNGPVRKTVTFIDKPLPPRTMNIMEKNQWFLKQGVKSMWCHPKHSHAYNVQDLPDGSQENATRPGLRFPYLGDTTEPNINDSLKCSTLKMSKLESPQKIPQKSPMSKKSPKMKAVSALDESGTASSEEEDGDGLLIDTDGNESVGSTGWNSNTSVSTSIGGKDNIGVVVMEDSSNNGSASVQKRVEKLQLASEKDSEAKTVEQNGTYNSDCADNAEGEKANTTNSNAFMIPAPFTNVNYQLWTMSKQVAIKQELTRHLIKNSAGTQDKDLRILVRNKLDGIMRHNRSTVPVCLSAKLEYQSEYGAEKLTKSELVNEWIALKFRPQSRLTRVRVNAETSEALLMETRTMEELVQDCKQSYGFGFVADITSTLYSVLSGLVDLPVGQYLLSHTKAMQTFTVLQLGNKEYGNFNLKESYLSVNPEVTAPVDDWPWLEIDMNVLMPYHVIFNRVPGTFYPLKIVQDTAPKIERKFLSIRKINKSKKKKEKKIQKKKAAAMERNEAEESP